MSALSITAGNVVPVADSHTYRDGLAGASISVGQVVYYDSATSTFKLADADLSATAATAVGIALNTATANQPVRVATGGSVGFGAIFTAGVFYYLSPTAGGICAVADLSGSRVTQLGYASTTSNFIIDITVTGVTLA